MKNLFKKYKEIILYIFFGGITTLINWIAYAIFVNMFPTSDSLIFKASFANILAWIIAFLFAFVVNKIFVFESRDKNIKIIGKEFLLFFLSRAFTGILEIVLLPLLIKIGISQSIFGIDGFLAKLIVSVIVTILNYIFSKKIVFTKQKTGN
jgi:putative flippase GtrA